MSSLRKLVYLHSNGDNVSEKSFNTLPKTLAGLESVELALAGRLLVCNFSNTDSEALLIGRLEELGLGQCLHATNYVSEHNYVSLVSVEGMTCQSCVKNIENTVGKEAGVRAIKVSLAHNEALVEYDPKRVSAEDLRVTIYDMGFDASISVTYEPALMPTQVAVVEVEGMVCSSCTENIESNLSKMKGVHSVKASLEEKLARVEFEPGSISAQDLAEAIYELGFDTKLRSAKSVTSKTEPPSLATSPILATSSYQPAALQQCLPTSNKTSDISHTCYIGIDGMTCHSCVSLIESVVMGLGGVNSATVSLSEKEAVVEYDSAVTSPDIITEAVSSNKKFRVTYVRG